VAAHYGYRAARHTVVAGEQSAQGFVDFALFGRGGNLHFERAVGQGAHDFAFRAARDYFYAQGHQIPRKVE